MQTGPRSPAEHERVNGASLVSLRVERISPAPGGQIRQSFSTAALQSLAESLKRSGVREPVIVAPDPEQPGRYLIVAGERRWRAAQLAGLTEIPCLVDESLADPKQRLLAQAEENLHRQDLNAVEEAAVLVQLMEAFGLDAEDAGRLIGRSYLQARRLLQIHEAPQPVRDAVVSGLIDTRAALELVRIHNRLARRPGPNARKRAVAEVDELIDRVVSERWTIRRLEAHAKRVAQGEARDRAPAAGGSAASPKAVLEQSAAPRDEPPAIPVPLLARDQTSAGGTPWRVLPGGLLQFDTGRIVRGEFSPHEYAALIVMFEELLMKTRHAPRRPRVDSPRG